MIYRFFVVMLCLGAPGFSAAVSVDDHPHLGEIVERLVSRHGLDRHELIRIFSETSLRPEVIDAIKSPAERLPLRLSVSNRAADSASAASNRETRSAIRMG